MKLKGIIFKCVVSFSWLLLVGTAALWARSYWYADQMRWTTPDDPQAAFPKWLVHWSISSEHRGMEFSYQSHLFRRPWPVRRLRNKCCPLAPE